ncbi:Tetracycline repressor protein class A from transposon 1721 [Actinomadura rubteroloni]|uniref:Tetracycline repressor protein class A from transposon 1721 n=1 Tax=Actinomadura rubteroloni TaxID=1926885 RepID=A0A2P4UD88_9ACTN|nr:TetR/AcrR family transcriptional regulator [Actinomadura rubteroloni]POM23007.1 Tetracycline repressor protein class A from transposon 1721 [Actinomadura rubteroloni]
MPPRKRGPRRSVDRSTVLDAALALVDSGGLPALTMRSLAAEVGLTPGALYTYFPDRAAIVSALVDALLAEADTSVLATARPWRERITTFALGLRDVLLRHPGIVPALLGDAFRGPVALTVGEHLLDALADAGLPPDEAARASYGVMVYVLGAIALEAAEIPPGAPAAPEDVRIAERRAALGHLDPSTHPRTHAAADTIAAYVSTGQFRWGLDRMLTGLRR